mmetsp:Transcript_18819/g.1653  ORF Transcript_18819/g.1653 Transcript_18819/m.1653 type:complete len:96 (+) Transcript_18819:184-471(+)
MILQNMLHYPINIFHYYMLYQILLIFLHKLQMDDYYKYHAIKVKNLCIYFTLSSFYPYPITNYFHPFYLLHRYNFYIKMYFKLSRYLLLFNSMFS